MVWHQAFIGPCFLAGQLQPNSHPDAEFDYVMTGIRGQEPAEGALYDRSKRTLIDQEITENIDFIKRKIEGQPFFASIHSNP